MTEIMGWSMAEARGLKFYYTGKPCRRGHIGPRYTKSRSCVKCEQETNATKMGAIAERAVAYKKANPDKVRAARHRYYEENREAISEKNKARYIKVDQTASNSDRGKSWGKQSSVR